MNNTSNRLVLSCRSLDYSGLLSRKPIEVPQIDVRPMDEAQVRQFLENYIPAKADLI